MTGESRPVTAHLDAENSAGVSVRALAGGRRAAVLVGRNAILDAAAVVRLLAEINDALVGRFAERADSDDVRLAVDLPGSRAVVFAASRCGASVSLRLGTETVRLAPARAIVTLSRMTALAMDVGRDGLAPLRRVPAVERAG